MRKAKTLTAIAVLTLVVAACGGSDTGTETTNAPAGTAATTSAPATTTLAAPGTTAAPATTEAPGGDTTGVTIEITTQGDAFSTDEIRVAAGQEVTIVVTDKDTETDDPHNFHVRAGDQNFFTNIEPAPNTQTISFTIETAGVYEFFCDTHALTMNGEFIVEDDM